MPGPVPLEVVAVACDMELEWAVLETAESLPALAGAVRWSWSEMERTVVVVDLRNLHGSTAGLDSLPGVSSRGPVARVSAIGQSLVRWSEKSQEALRVLDPDWILHWSAIGDGLSVLVPRLHGHESQKRLHDLLIS